ncbi:MAG: glycerol-3-phosphate acyltransferase [Clostridia bacterium]|nr:glycerol-3-phosphate acyltransferase [Clostridia bacterium]
MTAFSFWENWYQFVLLMIAGYFIGCLNFAAIIAKIKKKDITKIGSGNPGAMNMTREFGTLVGFLTFFLDAFKGGIPAMIVYFLYGNFAFSGTNFSVGYFAAFLIGAFVVLGHIFPWTMKFKGGKGISSGIGLFWLTLSIEGNGINPVILLIGLGLITLWPILITLTRTGSVISMSFLAIFGCWQIIKLLTLYPANTPFRAVSIFFVFFVVALSWFAHHKNMKCLLSGEEHETVMIKFKKKAKK